MIILLFALAASASKEVESATGIGYCAALQWNDAGNEYTRDAGADTAFGETVYIQYTSATKPVAAPALTGNNNTDPTSDASWNGTVVACSAQGTLSPCSSGTRWTCTMPEMANANVNYRVIVANQSNQWYGLQANDTLETGPNAVTLNTLAAATGNAPSLLAVIAGVLGLAGLGVGAGAHRWRRRRRM